MSEMQMTVQQPMPDQEMAREETPKIVSYWGMDKTEKFVFPDGIQSMTFKIMNEGDKTKFQQLTNKDLTITKGNDAKIKVDPAAERHTLIKTSVTDWFMYAPDKKTGEMAPAAFSKQLLDSWLLVADPKIVEDLEQCIRKANPWMGAEMTVEAIDEEIDRLHELRRERINAAAGEGSSASN